jgi:tRNA/rRNA methyltransferase
MKTMGLSDLRLVLPKQFPDPEADTRATGAVDVLQQAQIHDSLQSALAGTVFAVALSARRRDLGPEVGEPRAIMAELVSLAKEGEVALVFGNETKGMSNEEVMLCQAAVTIPTNPDFSSLNLGSAVQVLCYEVRMAAFNGAPPAGDRRVTPFESAPASHDEVEGFYSHLENVMTRTGFYNPDNPGRLMAKVRRLFARVRLEKDEVNILRGVLSSVQTPTSHGKKIS